MHHRTRTTPSLALAVRAQVAGDDARNALLQAAGRRLVRLRDDEDGAQAAEYAMLGGVGAVACTTLVQIFKRKEFIERLIKALVDALQELVSRWLLG